MLDFMVVSTRTNVKKGIMEIYPKFIIRKSTDLMIRGGDFYAIWVEDLGLWSTDEEDAINLIDRELDNYAKDVKDKFAGEVIILHMRDSDSGSIDRWHKYCQVQMRDNYNMLDEELIFSNTETNKKHYASKKLNYPLEAGEITAFEELMSTLYIPEERHKLEWAIGSIVSGDSKEIQKFMVLYGAAGTGKSTILNIIQKLFEGYYSVFDAKALGSASNSFALEAFKTNPLVAIQHDGDLSKIEDNTRLNSLVSHELMTINEKFKSTYVNRFKCFLFMGTNKPVRITDGKSGLIRRLIDVSPSGNVVPRKRYKTLMKQIDFELGAIAKHCLEVYLSDPGKYDSYIPISMMGASNDFYNFVEDSYYVFNKENGTTLKAAWEMYKVFCEDAKVPFTASRRNFKEELKNYFMEYEEQYTLDDGTVIRGYYRGFRTDRFEFYTKPVAEEHKSNLIEFDYNESIFDKEAAGYLAQYASKEGTPLKKWDKVKTTLESIDTTKLHYVKVPENHIVIDFDIPDKDGNKCFEKNLEEASKWPSTYAELSKSGGGIHLHYIYTGDVTKLSRVYDEHIEIKVFTGNSSLRRKLSKCNNLPIASISSGLPMKGEKNMINNEVITNEKGLRTLIKRNLNKEYHPGTKPSIDFIYTILEDAYNDGVKYDVTDMRNAIFAFAANSTNQATYCIKMVNKMKFKSEEPSEAIVDEEADLIFYDIEVFPNLFLVNWKLQGEGNPVIRMINPGPAEIESLLKFKLVGFNCRRYDNHMLFGCLMGYTNEQLYVLSQRIISGDRAAFFGEAYNLSYTDVYDFCSKKQSLKKWEIELGIHHQELGLPWDEPVPEERWLEVAEYCDNDVIATEAVFNARQSDFLARQILADLAGATVNDTSNSLTAKIVFGNNKKPQASFNYRDMGEVSSEDTFVEGYDEWTRFNKKGQPVFPGYEYNFGKSTYRGEEVGEGGYVHSEPGIYGYTPTLDIASMHPTSIEEEELFGEYTSRYSDIKKARVYIKHNELDKVRNMFGGVLAKYLDIPELIEALSGALKIPINSVYGLTAAKFMNAFRDPRNVDNIVAKRGALFMINLKHEVQKRGFIVAHIKTDSIKIPDATPEIIEFVTEYGKLYGYEFEHECTYDRMCLVNDAVLIGKYASPETCNELYGYIPKDNAKKSGKWSATGKQFAVPYLFKTLFSKEPIEFADLCETFNVTKGSLYLDMNEHLPDPFIYEKELEDRAKGKKRLNQDLAGYSNEDLIEASLEGHDYVFVGRVGLFCPIKPGCGGGTLHRVDGGKYYNAAGTTGYRWLEAEMVQKLGKEDDIDRSYYDKLVTDAVHDISTYGDYEWFVSDDPYVSPPYVDGKPVYLDKI